MAVKRVKPIWRPFARPWLWGVRLFLYVFGWFFPPQPQGRPRLARLIIWAIHLPLEDA